MTGNPVKKLKRLAGLLTIFGLILFFARCGDDEPFASQLVTFVLPISIEPPDSIINLGDTLWVVANIQDSLYEYHTKKKYKVSNLDFSGSSIGIRKLHDKTKDLSDQISAVSHFEVLNEIGDIAFLGDTFIDFEFYYNPEAGQYQLRFGFVSKTPGVYCIALLSPNNINYSGIIDLGKAKNGATIIPVFDFIFFPVNNGDNNYELFQQHAFDTPAAFPENYRDLNYIRYGTFTFRVVE